MPRIVYLSWSAREITGGIKMIFRHVEALRAAAFEAVVASVNGAQPEWFSSATPVLPLSEIRDDDFLVLPENHINFLREFAGRPNRKVVLCQNQFQVFRGLGDRKCYSDFGIEEIICVSHTVMQYCRRRFPNLSQANINYYIDRDTFVCPPRKRPQIACVPRKRPLEASFIRDLYRAEHPEFVDVHWRRIADANEQQVADILGQSALFLSLSRFEAFGLTTLEAMSCGCLVAGFTGAGGREYANDRNGFWAAEDDCLACVELLARATHVAREGGLLYRQMVREAVETARSYSQKRFVEQLLEYWSPRVVDASRAEVVESTD